MFGKLRCRYRLWRERCPHCGKDRSPALVFAEKQWTTGSLCPDLHFAVLMFFNYKLGGIRRVILDIGGRPIPLPPEFVKWREQLVAEIAEEK